MRTTGRSKALLWIPAGLGLVIIAGFVGLLAMNWLNQAAAPAGATVAESPSTNAKTNSLASADPGPASQSNGNSVSSQPDLSRARSMLYLLEADAKDRTREDAIELVASSDRDMIVLDSSFDGSSEGAWTNDEINRMRDGKPNRIMISYLSAGEAEVYRSYWHKKWDPENDGTPAPNAPPFLLPEHPDWEGNYFVKFWHDQWQEIIFKAVTSITNQGFDGIMLDRVDIFEDFELTDDGEYEDNRINPGTGRSFREDMVRFIEQIRHKQIGVRPETILLIQNGTQLLENKRLPNLLAGVVLEDLLTQDKEDREAIIEHVKLVNGESTPVFAVEYPDDIDNEKRYKKIIEQLKSLGFRYLITDRDLQTLGRSAD